MIVIIFTLNQRIILLIASYFYQIILTVGLDSSIINFRYYTCFCSVRYRYMQTLGIYQDKMFLIIVWYTRRQTRVWRTSARADRRFNNRGEVVRGCDTPGGVQLPIGNWGRISVKLKFAHRCSVCPFGQSLTQTDYSSLIKLSSNCRPECFFYNHNLEFVR